MEHQRDRSDHRPDERLLNTEELSDASDLDRKPGGALYAPTMATMLAAERSFGETGVTLVESEKSFPQIPVEDSMGCGEFFCFFVFGVGANLAFNGILSAVVFFKSLYGSAVFLHLTLAVQLPQLPLAMLQKHFDQKMDVVFSSRITFFVRLFVGFVTCGGALCAIPFFESEIGLIIATGLVGVASAVLYGSFYQLVSILPTAGGKTNVAFLTGTQACGPVLLLYSLASGFSDNQVHPTPLQQKIYFFGVAGLQGGAFLFFLWLTNRAVYRSAIKKKDNADLRIVRPDETLRGSRRSRHASLNQNFDPSVTVPLVRSVSKPYAVCQILTVGGTIVTFPFFTYVPSSVNDPTLPSILFYIQCLAEVIGTQSSLIVGILPPNVLLLLASLRFGLVALIPVYILVDDFPKSDLFFYVGFGVFFALHGFLVALANKALMDAIEHNISLGKQHSIEGQKNYDCVFLGFAYDRHSSVRLCSYGTATNTPSSQLNEAVKPKGDFGEASGTDQSTLTLGKESQEKKGRIGQKQKKMINAQTNTDKLKLKLKTTKQK